MIAKAIAVGIPTLIVLLGLWTLYGASQEGSSDVRGPGEAIGMLIIYAGLGVGAIELVAYGLYRFFVG